MKLIIGLGNPGSRYKDSRHNIGMRIVKTLAKENKIKLSHDRYSFSKRGKGRIKEVDLVLAHPTAFMNLSGESVNLLLEKYRVHKGDFLVVCDDLDLGLGRLRMRPRGSSGGHRGLQSIIDCIGTSDFNRLRIGIGRPDSKYKVKDFVLSAFSKGEQFLIKDTINKAVDCCKTWLVGGVAKAMSRFN